MNYTLTATVEARITKEIKWKEIYNNITNISYDIISLRKLLTIADIVRDCYFVAVFNTVYA